MERLFQHFGCMAS